MHPIAYIIYKVLDYYTHLSGGTGYISKPTANLMLHITWKEAGAISSSCKSRTLYRYNTKAKEWPRVDEYKI